MFCAPIRMLESRMAFETSPKAVNGGQTTMSTSLMLTNSILRSLTRSSASATVLFIFQFPAMINLRSLSIEACVFAFDLFLRERGHTGQFFAFQKLEARAAAGAHESDFVAELCLVHGFDAIAAADDAFSATLLC